MDTMVIRGEVIFVIYKKTVTTLLILHSYKLVSKDIKFSNVNAIPQVSSCFFEQMHIKWFQWYAW